MKKLLKSSLATRSGLLTVAAVGMLLFALASQAFPPAPSHLIYGQVRDEYGVPLSVTNAQIIFESIRGEQIPSRIVPNLEPSVNYHLNLSMDSGIAPDLYKITALEPNVPFRLRVKIGTVNYLPMEMVANYATLGEPAESTRIDLTLGVDADGDGLPDAWQRLLIAMLGPGAKIGPHEDADGDGISNLAEYLAGTYAFQPESGFRLNPVRNAEGAPMLEFLVVGPRTYTVYSSTDLQSWVPIQFNVPADGPAATNLPNYHATDIHLLRVTPVSPPGQPDAIQFFKVQSQ